MNTEINSALDNETQENIIEFSNNYPNNLIKHNIRPRQRRLISYLRYKAYSICCTTIPPDYIRLSFNKFKRGFVYYKDRKLIAFCIWKVKEHLRFEGTFKELYIYLICGKELDYKLVPRIIDDVVHFCRKNNIHYITLESANDILKSYYINCGFKERVNIVGSTILELYIDGSKIIPHRQI